ncbi:MAG: hypothetical protein J2P50_09100 [Hyphomicrobiaceae bacterium]|nr:hypothetical protein [Hyphomicrobiaceae bacterium]
MIEVRQMSGGDPMQFAVIVRDDIGETHHVVTMGSTTYHRLTGGRHTPARSIEAAFQFLLDREPKQSILNRFDITAIAPYFPDFEQKLPAYLARS